MLVLVAVVAAGCGGDPVADPPSTTVATTAADSTTTVVASTTTTTVYLGPRATFRAAGRTLSVKPSDNRKPYADLGDHLTVPADIQVDFGAPQSTEAVGTVIPKAEWDRGATAAPMEIVVSEEENRYIWRAVVLPGEYGLEVTFTITGVPVVVRAPIRVTGDSP